MADSYIVCTLFSHSRTVTVYAVSVVNHSGVDRNQKPKPTLQHLTRPNTTSAGRRTKKSNNVAKSNGPVPSENESIACSLDEPAALLILGYITTGNTLVYGRRPGTGHQKGRASYHNHIWHISYHTSRQLLHLVRQRTWYRYMRLSAWAGFG